MHIDNDAQQMNGAHVRARDLALLLSSHLAGEGDERFPLDRIRLQKAVFLVTMRGTPRLKSMYSFEPYNWGPFSGDLMSDLRGLVNSDLLTVLPVPGHPHGRYATTYVGERTAEAVWNELDPSEQKFLRSVRTYVTGKSFNHLLREVYAEYPNYATKSQFTG